jgi:HK97 family phage portal protein
MDELQRYAPSGLSRLDRLKEAVRAYFMGPILSSDHSARDFFNLGQSTATGIAVNEFTALNYSAVWAAVGLISGQVGSLPLVLYRKLAKGGKEKFEAHPLYRIIHDRPNPETSALVFRQTLQAHVLLWGNAYAEIQRNGAGRPYALWQITPDRVTPFRSDAGLQYRVRNNDGSDQFIAAADMIHVPGHGFDGVCGYSVIQKMRESIGLGMAAERFGGKFFGEGAQMGGVISVPTPRPNELAVENDRRAINSKHQGIERSNRFLMLYNGAKYERIGIPPNDAQFLETRQFQVDEVARWFNLPPHKLKELMRSTNNNIEHQNLEYYIDCLSPWLETWEQELCEKLISPLERTQQDIEFVTAGLLRGDAASRGEFMSKQFSNAMLTPDEGRALENRNPIAGGTDSFVALNLIPLSLARPYYESLIDENKAKAEAARRPPPEPAPKPDPAQAREIEILKEELATARKIAQDNEEAKDLASHQRDLAVGDAKALALDRDALRAQWTEACEQIAHDDAERKTLNTTIEALTARAETADGTIAAHTLANNALAADRDEALRTVLARTAERDEARHQVEALSLDVVSAQRDLDSERDAHRQTATLVDNVRAELALMTDQATSLGTDLTAAVRDVAAAKEYGQMVETDYRRVCGEKKALETALADGETAATSLRTDVSALTGQVAEATDTISALRQTLTETEQRAQETVRTVSERDEHIARQAAEAKILAARLTETTIAVRAVLIDAVQRGLVTRETDRVRKQQTPDKLAKWVEAFYPMHEDVCRTILRPAVKAWLVASGVDVSVDAMLDRVIPSYIGESTRALRGLLMETDAESLPAALERVCRRWETERAETLADRIMKEAA